MSKLLIGTVFHKQFAEFRIKTWIQMRPSSAEPGNFVSHFGHGLADRVALAEGDVESDDFRAIFAQSVEHMGKMCARERPMAKNFLRVLVNFHDYDAGIDFRMVLAAIAKASVNGAEFETLHKSEQCRWRLAQKGMLIDQEPGNCNCEAYDQRYSVRPPG